MIIRMESALEKEVEEAVAALTGFRITRGMPFPDVFRAIVDALALGLRAKEIVIKHFGEEALIDKPNQSADGQHAFRPYSPDQ